MNAPQYGYQPYPMPREGVAITTQYSAVFTPFFGAAKPKILVDDVEMPVAGWGRAALPVAPGQHHVHVHTPYVFPRRAGRADYTVDVAPGQFVELEYRAPMFSFSRGALGPPPQRYPGVGAVITFTSICLLIIVILLIIT